MQIQRDELPTKNSRIPVVRILPESPCGAVVIVHGIGGCKEEQLGLAWRIAEAGFAAFVLDLRGHGENEALLDHGVVSDVDTIIDAAGRFGFVAAVGHSMGGRLALLSQASFVFAISPAYDQVYSEKTFQSVSVKRNYRIRGAFDHAGFEVVKHLPLWKRREGQEVAFLVGSRDIPEIAAACRRLRDAGEIVHEIPEALHGDMFLMEESIEIVTEQLRIWCANRVAVPT